MRNYVTETYKPHEIHKCKRGCGNVTFSSLPRIDTLQTEITHCTKCGQAIKFSTQAMPIRIGYPKSRRQWNQENVPVLRISKIKRAIAKNAPLLRV